MKNVLSQASLNSFVVVTLVVGAVQTNAFAQSKKKSQKPVAPIAPVSTESAPVTNATAPASVEIPKDPIVAQSGSASSSSMSMASEDSYFRKGRMSLGVVFPEGGSLGTGSSAGARYFIADTAAVSGYVLLSHTKASKTTSFGISGKYQGFLTGPRRATPYYFAGAAFGVNTGDGAKGKDDPQLGFGGGLGVEVFFIKEFSAFADVGVNILVAPSDNFTFSTFTSKIGANYNFDL